MFCPLLFTNIMIFKGILFKIFNTLNVYLWVPWVENIFRSKMIRNYCITVIYSWKKNVIKKTYELATYPVCTPYMRLKVVSERKWIHYSENTPKNPTTIKERDGGRDELCIGVNGGHGGNQSEGNKMPDWYKLQLSRQWPSLPLLLLH